MAARRRRARHAGAESAAALDRAGARVHRSTRLSRLRRLWRRSTWQAVAARGGSPGDGERRARRAHLRRLRAHRVVAAAARTHARHRRAGSERSRGGRRSRGVTMFEDGTTSPWMWSSDGAQSEFAAAYVKFRTALQRAWPSADAERAVAEAFAAYASAAQGAFESAERSARTAYAYDE